jgi:hypothetical protein
MVQGKVPPIDHRYVAIRSSAVRMLSFYKWTNGSFFCCCLFFTDNPVHLYMLVKNIWKAERLKLYIRLRLQVKNTCAAFKQHITKNNYRCHAARLTLSGYAERCSVAYCWWLTKGLGLSMRSFFLLLVIFVGKCLTALFTKPQIGQIHNHNEHWFAQSMYHRVIIVITVYIVNVVQKQD